MGSSLAGNLEVIAASHCEKETQKHKLVKNNKHRQVGNRALKYLHPFETDV